MKKSEGKNWVPSFFLYFATGLMFLLAAGSVAAEVTEEYEPNTEVTVAGKVVGIEQELRGPVTFLLNSGDRFYYVVTGPRWYLREIGLVLEKGMRVEVTGSKMYGQKGNLYLVVYSIRDDALGRAYRFRDDSLKPLWKRRGRGMGMR
jgi:exonuclease VII large subunit